MTNNPYTKIKQNTIMTASPQELTLMLYDGAIKFANQAVIAIENKEIANAHNNIIRVLDIIVELQATLDMKYEVAESLDLMYDYIINKLTESNITKTVDPLNEAIGFIRELRTTWKEAMQIAKIPNQTKAL